jgi:outer membrane lipoprotein SlyB
MRITMLSVLAVSTVMLAACSGSPRMTSPAGSMPVTTSTTSSVTGYGVVQAIDVVPREQVYRMAVRMDNGSMQTLVQEVPPGVQVGDRVRLDNGVIIEHFR